MIQVRVMILSVLLFLSTVANAGIYLEPGLTYERGDNTVDWPSPLTTSTGSSQGLGFNLKAGLAFADTVFAGADLSFSKPNFKNSAVNYDAAATSNLYGVVVGGQMPVVGLRLWGGYIFDGLLDPESSNGYNVKFSGASGYKLGLGFHILMVSLNVEYLDLKYSTSTLEQAGPITFNSTFDGPLKNKNWVLSVSIPLTL